MPAISTVLNGGGHRRPLHSNSVSANVFRHIYRVTYADCTVGNHIYYGRYLNLLEAARGEFFRHLGLPLLQLQEQDTIFPVVECHLRYKAPARYDDVLRLRTKTTRVSAAKIEHEYQLLRGEDLIAQAQSTLACVDRTGAVQRVPEWLHDEDE